VEDDVKALELEEQKAVEAAVEFARASPFPPAGLIGDLTYA
jgi:hypothetical protein